MSAKLNWIGISLTAVNLALLAAILVWKGPSPREGVVRAERLELVDGRGTVRASLRVEESGEVVFRMMDPAGTIRVKLGAGEAGSGFVLLNDLTEPGAHLLATREDTFLTLTGRDGQARVVEP